jgi:hypothetical protein
MAKWSQGFYGGDMSRTITIALIIILAASSMLWVASVSAQSIPKPSVSELTLTFIDGYVQVTIKNQPYTSYNDSDDHMITLYYHIRMKDHYETNWHYTIYPVPLEYRLPEYFPASRADYTTMNIPYSGNIIGFSGREFTSPSGKVDFEVEALMGYSTVVMVNPVPFSGRPDDYAYSFNGELSGWSNPQTIEIANPQSTPTHPPTLSPAPTAPLDTLASLLLGLAWEKIAIIALVVAVAVLTVGFMAIWRRMPKK